MNVAAFHAFVTIQGKDYPIEALPGKLIATPSITGDAKDGLHLNLKLQNDGDQVFAIERIFWEADTAQLTPELGFSSVYLEGWAMPTPCGKRLFTECDFDYNPDYVRFVVADDREWRPKQPGKFRAENAVIFQNGALGEAGEKLPMLMMAFVTAKHHYGRFVIDAACSHAAVKCICGCDGRELAPGQTLEAEELFVKIGNEGTEALLREFADRLGKNCHARLNNKAPLGWCSWYYYFEKVTEADMVENIDFFKAHQDDYPVKYIQLDDGYQHDLGEWLICNEKFPHGLAWLAEYAKKNGFIPGLWLAPFQVAMDSEVWRKHPEYMIHDKDGKPIVSVPWRTGNCAILDGSNPGAREWLRELMRNVRKMGFDYVKLDFLEMASSLRDGVLYDKTYTRFDALNSAMKAIREGFGDDGFILTCTAPTAAIVGIADFNRIGTDITPYWTTGEPYDEAPNVPNVCRNVVNHAYMNHRLFVSDPDTIIVRDDNTKLTEQECALWRDAIMLGGGSLLLSDRMCSLTPHRAQWLKDIIRHHDEYDTVPVDRSWNYPPQIWRGTSRIDGHVVEGHFDFTAHTSEIVKK
jgi:alpha-galactosidase